MGGVGSHQLAVSARRAGSNAACAPLFNDYSDSSDLVRARIFVKATTAIVTDYFLTSASVCFSKFRSVGERRALARRAQKNA
jgi:hypothetical protein